MTNPQIAVIVGSNRRDSINRKLAQALIKLGAGKFDAKIVRIDDLPMYNQDHEGTLPAEVVRFKDELAQGRRRDLRYARNITVRFRRC